MTIERIADKTSYPVVGYIAKSAKSNELWVLDLGHGVGASVADIRDSLEVLPIYQGRLVSGWYAEGVGWGNMDAQLKDLKDRVIESDLPTPWHVDYVAGFPTDCNAQSYPTGYKAETITKKYVAGWNLVGYMPEVMPEEFDSIAEARAYLTEELGLWMDQAYEIGDDEAGERLNKQAREMYDGHESTAGIYVEDGSRTYSFWIVEAEQD